MATALPPLEPAPRSRTANRTRLLALLGAVTAVALAVVFIVKPFQSPADDAMAEAPASAPLAPMSPPATPGPEHEPGLAASAPERLSIPEINVDAPFVPLHLGEDDRLDVPPRDDPNLVGWYANGATPGEPGTAIVVGHLDTKTSAAVFARLGELTPGSRVDIHREDGSLATFTVDSVETFDKEDFPDERVYAEADTPELRLLTCAGTYDRAAENYDENLVVFARLDTPQPPPAP